MLLLAAFLLFFIAICICIACNIFILYPLLWGLFSMGFVAWRHGHSLRSIISMGYRGAKQSLIVVEIFFYVGALTAAWRAAGVIGFLVYHGLQLLTPETFLFGCFLLPLIFSMLLGTAIGTEGVIGIALIVIAKGGGVDPALAAGAIIAGAYFGDRGSPMASSAHLIASITGTDVIKNLRNMAWSAALPLLLCLAGYIFLSFRHPLERADAQFTEQISTLFVLHPITLIAPLLILVCGIFHVKIKYAMLASTLVAIVMAVTLQDMALVDVAYALVVGYTAEGENAAAYLFSGGGWISVASSMLIVFFSSAFTGIFKEANLLSEVEKGVTTLYHKIGGYLTNLVVSTVASAAACNQTLAILLAAQIQNPLYPPGAARARFVLWLENTVTLVSVTMPWNIALSLPLSVLDVGAECIPYMLFVWIMPLLGWLRWPEAKLGKGLKF